MISIENNAGELIKVINGEQTAELGFHKLFGFIGSESAARRLEQRRLKGFEFDQNEWLCRFSLDLNGNEINLKNPLAYTGRLIPGTI